METVINQEQLLEASPSAEKAKKMGLSYAGYGKWKNKDGYIVAKTVDGKLISIAKLQKMAAAKKNAPIHNKVNGIDAVKQKVSNFWKKKINIHKTFGDYNYLIKTLTNFVVKPKISYNQFDEFKSTVHNSTWGLSGNKLIKLGIKLRNKIQKRGNENEFLPPEVAEFVRDINVPGEKVKVANTNSRLYKAIVHGPTLPKTQRKKLINSAVEQTINWRLNLNERIASRLWDIQQDWQGSSQWSRSLNERKRRNRFLNKVIGNSKQPAIVKTSHPIERGMALEVKDLKKFLKAFAKGKTITMPPSGFSAEPSTARTFMQDAMGGDDVGILLRIHPQKKTIYGMHCHHLETALSKDKRFQQKVNALEQEFNAKNKLLKLWVKKNPPPFKQGDGGWEFRPAKERKKWINWNKQKEIVEKKLGLSKYPSYPSYDDVGGVEFDREEAETRIRDQYPSYEDNFNEEWEIIRPGNALARVRRVSKFLFPRYNSEEHLMYYVIDLEDAGLTKKKNLIKEDEENMAPQERHEQMIQLLLQYKYLNNSIHSQVKNKADSKEVLDKYSGPLKQST